MVHPNPALLSLTKVENFSLSGMLTKKIEQQDCKQTQKCGAIFKILWRSLGFAALPIAGIVDMIAHAVLFTGKLALGIVLLPYNFIATFVNIKQLPRDLTLTSACVHFIATLEGLIHSFSLSITILLNPAAANAMAHHALKNEGKLAQKHNTLELENQRLKDENTFHKAQLIPLPSTVSDDTSSEESSESSEETSESSEESSESSEESSESSEETSSESSTSLQSTSSHTKNPTPPPSPQRSPTPPPSSPPPPPHSPPHASTSPQSPPPPPPRSPPPPPPLPKRDQTVLDLLKSNGKEKEKAEDSNEVSSDESKGKEEEEVGAENGNTKTTPLQASIDFIKTMQRTQNRLPTLEEMLQHQQGILRSSNPAETDDGMHPLMKHVGLSFEEIHRIESFINSSIEPIAAPPTISYYSKAFGSYIDKIDCLLNSRKSLEEQLQDPNLIEEDLTATFSFDALDDRAKSMIRDIIRCVQGNQNAPENSAEIRALIARFENYICWWSDRLDQISASKGFTQKARTAKAEAIAAREKEAEAAREQDQRNLEEHKSEAIKALNCVDLNAIRNKLVDHTNFIGFVRNNQEDYKMLGFHNETTITDVENLVRITIEWCDGVTREAQFDDCRSGEASRLRALIHFLRSYSESEVGRKFKQYNQDN